MHKKVTLNLEMESEWESSVYAAIGDLLAEIEDSNFTVKNVKIEDVPPLTLVPTPRLAEIKTQNDRPTKNWRSYDDYDGQ
jgi:hypothetical protein